MLPKTLALVDDDRDYIDVLSQQLAERSVRAVVFASSNDLLAHEGAYHFDFYVVDFMLPGIDGLELIKVLRRRTSAGVLVVSGHVGPQVYRKVVDAGADMYLAKPVVFEHVITAIEAVQRRARIYAPIESPWTLDQRARQLIAPGGASVDLSDTDLLVMNCLLKAQGKVVTRESLCQALGRVPDGQSPDGLTSIIFRLRRRIERATSISAPLQSKTRVGYFFRAPLSAV